MSGSIGGLISEPLGSIAQAQPMAAVFPSTAWEGQDWFAPEKQLAAEGQRFQAETGAPALIDPSAPASYAVPEPRLDPDTLNRLHAVGDLKFTSPLPESVAAAMADAKRDELMRQDAAARTPPGFGPSAARLAAGFITGALDPVNLAAAFVPGLGEADVARTLGLVGAESLLARRAVRGVVGASQGIAGQVPLSALRFGLSQQDGQDYSALSAMSDIALGGVLGGGLHAAIGGVGDLIGRAFNASAAARIMDQDPQARADALRTAVAAVAEDRPVDVQPGLDAAAAAEAERHLTALQAHQASLDAELSAATGGPRSGAIDLDRADALDAATERLAGLRRQTSTLTADLADQRERLARDTLAASDPVSADRVAAIDDELSSVIPRARRQALVSERAMLLEGRDVSREASGVSDLEVGRSQSVVTGTEAELARMRSAIAETEADIGALNHAIRVKSEADEAARPATERAQRIGQQRADGRQAVAQAYAERVLRRLAGQSGIPDSDIATLAGSVLSGDVAPREAVAAIDRWRQPDGGTAPAAAPGVTAAPSVPGSDAVAHLRREASGAALDASRSEAAARAAGRPAADDAAASAAADRAAMAPKPVATVSAEHAAEMDRFVTMAREAGALSAADEAELRAADALVREAADTGNAIAAAAACMIRSAA